MTEEEDALRPRPEAPSSKEDCGGRTLGEGVSKCVAREPESPSSTKQDMDSCSKGSSKMGERPWNSLFPIKNLATTIILGRLL